MFPQDTSIDVYAEETPYIKGGIVHISVLDNNGNGFYPKGTINVTMIDEDGHSASENRSLSYDATDAIYRYGGGHDEVWKDLNVYGKYTIEIQYSGELGYKPCNITKEITINPKKMPK